MSLFTGMERFSIGNKLLDRQHRKIFRLFDRLYESMQVAGNGSAATAILDDLIACSTRHILAEDRYLTASGTEELAHHLLAHRFFSERLASLKQSYDEHTPEIATADAVFLSRWLFHHVTEEDSRLFH